MEREDSALYSRPLSKAARESLIDFVDRYLKTLSSRRTDGLAEEAKEAAIRLLKTDIDIALLGVTFATVLGQRPGLLTSRSASTRELATRLVHIVEVAREIDIIGRPPI